MLPTTRPLSPGGGRPGRKILGMDATAAGRIGLLAAGVIVIGLFFLSFTSDPPGAVSTSALSVIPPTMRLAVIADLDQQSRQADSKGMWGSIFKSGTLSYDAPNQHFTIEWDEDKWLYSRHAEGKRGMELSELVNFAGRMLTCDDRSGMLYEVLGATTAEPRVVPRHIMMEGDGETDKGFKCEWMAVKGDQLYVGSFGKEYTNADGSVKNRNNMWIMQFDPALNMVRSDWSSQFTALREHFGYGFPAYLLHETVLWSETRQQWVFLPRRMSKDPYDDRSDERKGGNTVMLANEAFNSFSSLTVGKLTPERGFSTAKWVPGSGESVLVAIKSEENAELNTQASYISIFNMEGAMLLPETPIPGRHKYEGVEFLL